MELKVIDSNDAYMHLALSGKLDIAGVSEIESQFMDLISTQLKNAVVDISQVTFTGSMGLRLFLQTTKRLRSANKSLILVNPQPLVNSVLKESGITDLILVEHNTESALAKVRS